MGENRLKKRFSGVLTCAMVATLMPTMPVAATTKNVEMGIDSNVSNVTTSSIIEVNRGEDIKQTTTGPIIGINSWKESAFGASVTEGEHSIEIADNTITMTSVNSGNSAGKVSKDKDGINFYYQTLSNTDNFEIKVKAKVLNLYATNKQISFGLMLRDTVATNGEAAGSTEEDLKIQGSRMLGVGVLEQKMQSFARVEEKGKYAINHTFINSNAQQGTTYDLAIKKYGNAYQFMINGVTSETIYSDLFTDEIYAGIYTARAVSVEYTDLEIEMAEDISNLKVESMPNKLSYLKDEPLDLTGLVVTADGKEISQDELIITGYDASKVGTQKVTINYANQEAFFEVNVDELTCTGIEVAFTPAKTTYYLNDEFDPTGMTVKATYNSGKVVTLSDTDYQISTVDLSTPGSKIVTVTYEGQTASFTINVLEDELTGLKIAKMPVKTLYYIGENFESKGMAIKAVYGDTEVLLEEDEYTITQENFDNQVAKEQSITVHHKGKTIEVPVTVKAKEATGIKVTKLPKTTYTLGDTLSLDGITISKVYDNGDETVLAEDEYEIDDSSFNGNQVGSYTITVTPLDTTLKAITFIVEVREPITYEWKYITFGQSTGEEKNYIKKLEDGGIKLVAEQGAGKITNSFQDGITYYYTELNNTTDNFVLSADIKVNKFAKTPTPDNQEGFGIMARDAIGVHNDASVFYSNIAAVGGYRGVTQMVMRSGVTASDSTGAANGVQEATILNNERPSESNTGVGVYRLTLKKDNTGYTGSLTTPSGTKEHLYYEPDALGVQNDTLYVGFYAARLADIDVYNIDLEVTSTEADAPKVEAPVQAITPNFTLNSLTASSTTDYDLNMYANVNGTVTIKQGEEIIARDIPVVGGETFTQKTALKENAMNLFTVTFVPDTDQNLTSYSKIVKNLSVEMKTYGNEGDAIYVSPTGSSGAEGTLEDPLSIDRAISFVRPGQTIYLLEGTYELTKSVGIEPGNNGSADAIKTLAAYPGAKVVLDCGKRVSGFNLDGDYWHIFGIDFTGATSTGFRVGGNNNTIELCNFYSNGDTGMQISRYGNGGYDTWPANNLILNCTSYDNIDASENNADGFAAKLTCGPGNVFKGCISHNNIDDAWDLFAKGSTGPIGAVTIEDCIAYSNGTLTNGYVGKGDKNGFKLGGEGIAVPHVIKNSISFNNGATGFSSNSNPAVISENCIAYDNEAANFDWRVYTDVTPQFVAKGNISYRSSKGAKDVYPESLTSDDNYYFDGEKSVNAKGIILTDANFKSLVAPEGGYERDEEGNIIFGDFLSFIAPKEDIPNTGEDTDNNGDSSEDNSGNDNTNDDSVSDNTDDDLGVDNSGNSTITDMTIEKVEQVVKEAIDKGESAVISVNKNYTVGINQATIENLVKKEALLSIESQKVTIELDSIFLSANILSQSNKEGTLKVSAAPIDTKQFEVIRTQFNENNALKVIGGTELTTVLGMQSGSTDINFKEPAKLTIKLNSAEVKDPAKLTLVKYELQKDGTYKVVKIGGTYDAATNTLVGKVAGAGVYGVAEAESLLKVNLKIGQKETVVNDKVLDNDVAPEIINGSTMVPLRFIAENLGADVSWDNKTKEVTVTLEGESIILGKEDGTVIKNNRTLVPIRYISEHLGANVLWVNSAKEIEIVK